MLGNALGPGARPPARAADARHLGDLEDKVKRLEEQNASLVKQLADAKAALAQKGTISPKLEA